MEQNGTGWNKLIHVPTTYQTHHTKVFPFEMSREPTVPNSILPLHSMHLSNWVDSLLEKYFWSNSFVVLLLVYVSDITRY